MSLAKATGSTQGFDLQVVDADATAVHEVICGSTKTGDVTVLGDAR